MLGSAQIAVEANGLRIVASGDYKRRADPTCLPFVPVPCDIFITEATFGLPVFRHPEPEAEIGKLLASLAQFPERAHLVGAYSLGKAQRVIRMLRDAGYDRPIYLHGSMEKLCRLYEEEGVALGPLAPATIAKGAKGDFAGAVVICPPSEIAERWARRFPDPVPCFASGWMRIRQRAKQAGVELPLILSDHADWDELTATIAETRAVGGLGDPRPRGGAGPLVRAQRHPGQAAAHGRLRGRGVGRVRRRNRPAQVGVERYALRAIRPTLGFARTPGRRRPATPASAPASGRRRARPCR